MALVALPLLFGLYTSWFRMPGAGRCAEMDTPKQMSKYVLVLTRCVTSTLRGELKAFTPPWKSSSDRQKRRVTSEFNDSCKVLEKGHLHPSQGCAPLQLRVRVYLPLSSSIRNFAVGKHGANCRTT